MATALTVCLAMPALAGPVNWAHQAGAVQSNGAVVIKSLSGNSYAATGNPTGSAVRMNQNAATQPPTVIVEASTTIPCFYGMQLYQIDIRCKPGGPVLRELYDSRSVARYVGKIKSSIKPYAVESPAIGTPEVFWYQQKGLYSWGCNTYQTAGTASENGGEYATERIVAMMTSYSLCNPKNEDHLGQTARSAAYQCHTHPMLGQAFLPSPKEMKMLYENSALYGPFPKIEFWTTQEVNEKYAYTFDMASGTTIMREKKTDFAYLCMVKMPFT